MTPCPRPLAPHLCRETGRDRTGRGVGGVGGMDRWGCMHNSSSVPSLLHLPYRRGPARKPSHRGCITHSTTAPGLAVRHQWQPLGPSQDKCNLTYRGPRVGRGGKLKKGLYQEICFSPHMQRSGTAREGDDDAGTLCIAYHSAETPPTRNHG